MKIYITTFLLIIISTCIFSQDLSRLYVTRDGEFLPNEFIRDSKENYDINGKLAAGLLVVSDLTGLSYTSNNGMVKEVVNRGSGEDLLFLQPEERIVTIYRQGFEPLQILLNDYSIKLESGKVWKIRLTGDKKLDLIPVNILTTPADVTIIVDGINKGVITNLQLTGGDHQISLVKDGYRTRNETINVSTTRNLFNFDLSEIDLVKLNISSIPPGAQIYLNNILEGETDKDFYRLPGTYACKLTKSGYLDETSEIEVSETGNNKFIFSLKKNSVTLTLNVTPSDAKVLINMNDYSNRNDIELAPGRYKIEISKTGFAGVSDFVDLELGTPLTKIYTLTRLTGKLQFTVQPTDADVRLLQNNRVVKSWQGSNYLKDLGVGSYTLDISKTGYTNQSKNITITENKTEVVDITLVPASISKSDSPTTAAEPEMIFVKGGTFEMGSNEGDSDEKPIHHVTINDFYISKYEVTFAEYDKFCEATGKSKPNDQGWGRGNRPAINVTWNDAKAFCEWIGGRLPTEAEWEYAALGGNKSNGYKYSGSNNLDEVGWYSSNSSSKAHPVGEKKPNELGLYDMSGNAWEWCADWYGENYYSNSPGTNPQGPSSGSSRVLRGGSWSNNVNNCRTANRARGNPASRGYNGGFRFARD